MLGIKISWNGSGLNEVGFDERSKKDIIKISKDYFRPTEVDLLIGDSSKAKKIIDWDPKVKFKDLVKIMVEAELSKYNKA